MSYDIDIRDSRGGRDLLPRDVRRAAVAIRRHQLDNQVGQAQADSDTDRAIGEMEDDTIATGSAMEKIVRVARLQRQLEEVAPEASGRLALLADDHAFGMSDSVSRLRRRLHR